MSAEFPRCHDCAAEPGQIHDNGCDVATCLHTGRQRLACRYFSSMSGKPPHDCGEDVWPGYDRNLRQAERYGLFAYCPPRGSPVRCGADHPEAIPDVNRLMLNGAWDRDARLWVLLDGVPL